VIHLDTSFLIRALVRSSAQDKALREWLRAGEPLGISTIGWAEFLCGPIEVDDVDLAASLVPRHLPFGEDEAMLAARLFNVSGRRRGSLMDCMVAATAIRHEALLATANEKDFARFRTAGLRIVGG
jgi:predicted nucleic acid-binding protein